MDPTYLTSRFLHVLRLLLNQIDMFKKRQQQSLADAPNAGAAIDAGATLRKGQ